jgi:predicted acyltransferase
MQQNRVAAIDIFRALTMFLMIFVNDLWTLNGVPSWMLHATFEEDRLGLSDWVFPGFLFIVGLSIPFAVTARKKKGDSSLQIFKHIVKRSIALITMGFFMVNLENINNELLPFSKYVWQLLMALAILLIWNIYPQKKAFGKVPEWIMQLIGILILVGLSLVFRSGTAADPKWMEPHWWGILGIIGWAYLGCALLYLIIGNRLLVFLLVFVAFHLLNVLEFVDLPGFEIKLMVSASNHVSIAAGVLTSLMYIKYGSRNQIASFLTLLAILSVVSLLYGFILRPEWGISKIRATPSWSSICVGISVFAFAIIYIVTDLWRKVSWASVFAPAGRSTLTCYLVPYFYYAVMMLVGIFLPEVLRTGFIGIIKSLLFSFLIIFITGMMEKVGLRLKV